MTVLTIASKGASDTIKTILKDLSKIINTVEESQFDLKKRCHILEKYMDINDCDTAIFFEITKRIQKLHIATASSTVRFVINSISSSFDMNNLNNYHIKGGHVLCFSSDFEDSENLKISKVVLEKAFGQNDNPSKERAICFFYTDGKIYVRNYLLDGMKEVGPRMELEIDSIIDGCFRGEVLYRRNTKPIPSDI